MYQSKVIKRAGAAALSLALAFSLVPTAGATVKPVVDEAFYGTLDYYGALTDGSVVKSYRTNGNTTISDIGDYTEVNNLTDRTQPEIQGNRVIFPINEGVKNFYFEGKTSKPFQEMPFFIHISYRMNGVDCDAEDMAGQTGLAEINLDITPNPAASAYQRNNFALEAVTMCKDSRTLSIEAPGGQVQKVGDMDVVLFMAFPGEEQHFTLRIGSEDFSFNGFTFLCQPATLAQLDQIADLREAREELEDAAGDLSDSIDAILASLEGMDGNLRNTANGLEQLNRARATVSAGKANVYNEADRTLASLTDLTESLQPVVEHIKTTKTALAENTEQLQTLTGSIDGLRPELQNVKDGMVAVQGDLNALNHVLNNVEADTTAISKELEALEKDLDGLRSYLDDLQVDTKDLRKEVQKIDGSSVTLKEVTSIPFGKESYTPAQIQEMHETAQGVHAAAEYLTYADPSNALIPKKEDSFTKFVLQNAENIANVIVSQNADAIEEKVAQALTAQNITPETVGTEKYAEVYTEKVNEAMTAAIKEYTDQLSDETNVRLLALLYYQWDDGIKISKQLTQLDTFNKYIRSANSDIKDINKRIRALRDPSVDLMKDIEALLDELKDDTLDDAQDLLTTARKLIDHAAEYDNDSLNQNANALIDTSSRVIDRLDGILDQTATLSQTVSKYEPDAQAALNDATVQVDDSIRLLSDLNTFSKSLENLMKAAGTDLDQGGEASLTGLSNTLRRAADGLSTTSTVRRAKDTITRLVEDKWDEYTGQKNNLLNMDSNAEMISLTSPQNQTPNSIQLVLRSQEIKVDEDAKAAAEGATAETETTFWGRVGQMFHDFAAIFTGG